MNIEEVINDIFYLRKQVQHGTQSYLSDPDFISIIDSQLNAKAKILLLYLKKNNLEEYSALFDGILPIESNAIEFCEVFISIVESIREYEKWNNPGVRTKLINELAYHMQKKYVRFDIDSIFLSCNIKHGDEFYTFNSKRVYVQNVLQQAHTIDIIKLAKSENLVNENIDVTETMADLNNVFIEEQIEKCNKKIILKDYDGAITNARSLVEEVLLLIEEKINGSRIDYDGDILKLYKRVRKFIKLDPNDGIDNSLNEIMRGFVSIISGLAGLSNDLGDRHAQRHRPDKRHAVLIVNSALIITKFFVESYNCQYI